MTETTTPCTGPRGRTCEAGQARTATATANRIDSRRTLADCLWPDGERLVADLSR